jgi:hypothetical protein
MTLCRHYGVVDLARHVFLPTLTVDYRTLRGNGPFILPQIRVQ